MRFGVALWKSWPVLARLKAWLDCRRRAAEMGFPYHDYPDEMRHDEWIAYQEEWRDRISY